MILPGISLQTYSVPRLANRLPHATIRIYILRALMPGSVPERLCRMTFFPMLRHSISRRSLLVAATGGYAGSRLLDGLVLGQSTPVDHTQSSLGWNDELGQDN